MGEYEAGSRMADLERRYLESAARLEAARLRRGALEAELRSVEDQWTNATAENMTPEAFSILDARRVLLLRSVGRAKAEAGRLEEAHKPMKQAYEQQARSLLDAQDRRAVAEYRGDLVTVRACDAQIAALTKAPVGA